MRADEHAPNAGDSNRKYVYWHRELPPFAAEMIGEHVLERRAVAFPAHSTTTASCGIAHAMS